MLSSVLLPSGEAEDTGEGVTCDAGEGGDSGEGVPSDAGESVAAEGTGDTGDSGEAVPSDAGDPSEGAADQSGDAQEQQDSDWQQQQAPHLVSINTCILLCMSVNWSVIFGSSEALVM